MKLIKYLKPYAWLAIISPLLMIGEVVVDLFQPKLMAKIVDEGVLAGNMDVTISTGILMLVLVIIGGFFGFVLKWLMPKKRSNDNRLIISVSTLFVFCGICALLDISPLLGCITMGMVYINITGDDKLFKQLNYFSPPFLLLFFPLHEKDLL